MATENRVHCLACGCRGGGHMVGCSKVLQAEIDRLRAENERLTAGAALGEEARRERCMEAAREFCEANDGKKITARAVPRMAAVFNRFALDEGLHAACMILDTIKRAEALASALKDAAQALDEAASNCAGWTNVVPADPVGQAVLTAARDRAMEALKR